MIREVCLFDKFSFCKNGVRCTRIHLKEVCQIRECDYKICNKRHPKPCRIFRLNGFCRFGANCKYSHKLPQEIYEQNKKIISLEKVTAKLTKQVEEQDDQIKDLKRQLLESESRELMRLQKQINDLARKNEEKGKALAKLEEDFKKFKVQDFIVEKVVEDQGKEEEAVESVEVEKEKFEKEFLKNLDILEGGVKKVRNFGTTNSTQLRSKVKIFNTNMQKIKKNIKDEVYLDWLNQLSDVEKQEEKIDREDLISLISLCKWRCFRVESW